MNIRDYERKGYSQFGETGIIAELCRRLDPPRYFVEIGIENGQECMTRDLIDAGWCGRQIEAREDCWRDAADLNRKFRQRVWTICERVSLENLSEVMAGVPRDHFGLLSIDVDGNDSYFWEGICGEYSVLRLKPWIVVIEVNHNILGGEHFRQPYDEDWCWDGHRTDYGTSLASMNEIAVKMGYVFVGDSSEHVNAFYIRADLVEKLDD